MPFSALEGRRVGAWGAGREIRALARAMGGGLAVIATDAPLDGDSPDPGARLVSGDAIGDALATCDVVVRSPGVSIHRPEMRALRERGVVVTTSTALWLEEADATRVIGVTGTKGKSTTAALTAHLLRASGATVELAGNVGIPAIELRERPADWYVLELSSFQIADLGAGPRVAVYTNLYQEHVDWHGSPEAYRRDKLRLAALPRVEVVVANGRDPALTEALPDAVRFGVPGGFDLDEQWVLDGGHPVVARADLPVRGPHNALNACAALAAVRAAGVELTDPARAFAGFAPLPHRLETVAEHDGVLWVNDSISTTPESTLAALDTFPERRVLLLGGGHDREQDYAALGEELARRGASVFGLPRTGERIVAAARAHGATADLHPDLDAAVAAAAAASRPGDVLLLSPAAPSFGAYASFEERGEHFRALALAYPGGQ